MHATPGVKLSYQLGENTSVSASVRHQFGFRDWRESLNYGTLGFKIDFPLGKK